MCNKQIYWQGREYPALTLHAERKGWKKPKEKDKGNEEERATNVSNYV